MSFCTVANGRGGDETAVCAKTMLIFARRIFAGKTWESDLFVNINIRKSVDYLYFS